MLKGLTEYRDTGLFLLRLGIGTVYVVIHGGPKLFAGKEQWIEIGSAVSNFGIESGFLFWGLLAACSEFIGGMFLIFGFLFRPALIMLLLTMIVATAMQIEAGHEWGPYVSHPFKMSILFLSLMFIGPGKYSFDKR